MNRRILLILLLCSTVLTLSAARELPMPVWSDVAPRDTTDLGEDNDEDVNQKVEKTRQNKAEGLNAFDYIMERRYRANGEEFTKKWDDHLFIQAGLGLQQMAPPADSYKFNTLSAVQLGVGKQFNKLNSARAVFDFAWGYQQGKDRLFTKFGLHLEHLFSLSSYFSGFKPSRLMDISTIMGVGVQFSKLSFKNMLYEEELQKQIDKLSASDDEIDQQEAQLLRESMPKDKSGTSFEGHMGLQLRFFTGPQGYVNIEPYIGIATDKMDLCTNLNWRKTDVFYGINLNYIYYIHNNLSPRERRHFIKHRREDDQVDNDSTQLQTWQQPWFFEYANGINFLGNSQLGAGSSMGSDFSISVGRWLSPVIGFRLTGSVHQTTWRQSFIQTSDETETIRRGYVANMHNIYTGVRLEALFNPFGFFKDFSWEKPYGAYLTGGVEYGWVDKYQTERLSTRSEAYNVGAHLWYQLSDGLHVFVEPRYMHYVYKLPYTNVDWNKNYTDNGFQLSFGVQIATRSHRFRQQDEDETAAEPLRQIRAGIAGGFYQIHTKQNFEGDGGVGLNAKVFAEYHFTPIHAARASFEFLPMKHSGLRDFWDTNTMSDTPELATIERYGMWNYNFKLGLINVGYQANLSNLLAGYPSKRRFDLSAFVGPTVVMVIGKKSELSPSETLMEGHIVEEKEPVKSGMGIGAHLGVKLRCKIMPHISAFAEPTFYLLGNTDLPTVDFLKIKYLQTLNFGVQYEL